MSVLSASPLTLALSAGTRLYMKLDPSFQGRVGGLCGNFDGDTENDFTTRQGIVESTSDLFGNSWRVSQSCPEVHNANLQHPCTVSNNRTTVCVCVFVCVGVFERVSLFLCVCLCLAV